MSDEAPSRVRILYYYGSQQLDTGSPKALLGLIDALDNTAFEPCFLVNGTGPLVDAIRARKVKCIDGDVASISMRRPVWSLQRILVQRRRLRQWRVSLLHVNEFGWNTDLVLAARLEGIAVVLHVHNPVKIHWQNLNRFAAHSVLTVSHAQVGTIEGFRRIRHKHRVLYNTIDTSRFSSGSSIRPALGYAPSDFVVVTVAQVCRRKGIDLVLQIARQLLPRHEHLRFAIVGPTGVGEQDYADQLREETERPELLGRVAFLGSRQDVPDVLASSDVFLFPTRAEPFGIAIVEAMAAELPVVASAVGGIPEILTDTAIGTLVVPGDVRMFADGVEALLKDPVEARAIGRRAALSVHERFGAKAIGQELNTLYQSLLES